MLDFTDRKFHANCSSVLCQGAKPSYSAGLVRDSGREARRAAASGRQHLPGSRPPRRPIGVARGTQRVICTTVRSASVLCATRRHPPAWGASDTDLRRSRLPGQQPLRRRSQPDPSGGGTRRVHSHFLAAANGQRYLFAALVGPGRSRCARRTLLPQESLGLRERPRCRARCSTVALAREDRGHFHCAVSSGGIKYNAAHLR